MCVIALLALTIAAVSAVPANPQRIVGGELTTIDQYPSIASLLYTGDMFQYFHACGGTILNNRCILTAAHCVIGDHHNRWRVRVGSTFANSGGVIHHVSTIHTHPNFSSRTYDSDIAVMHTFSFIVPDENVRPASIAGANYNLGDNQAVWAAGWGTIKHTGIHSPQLRHVQIGTVNQNTCAQNYATRGVAITANMLCSGMLDVGGRGQCSGDDGGPLYHNGVVVGVYSFGFECARPLFPGVNTRVSRYTSWIQSHS